MLYNCSEIRALLPSYGGNAHYLLIELFYILEYC